MPNTKICCRDNCHLAGQPQPIANFHVDPGSPSGYRYQCKSCTRADSKRQRERRTSRRTAAVVQQVVQPPPPPEDQDFIITEELPVEPEEDLVEMAREAAAEARGKRDLKREHQALLEQNERLKDRVAELVQMQKPPDLLIYSKPSWERSDAVAVGIASDWHVEEPVEKASVHGLNEYNLDVATFRARLFFENLLRLTDMAARDSKITTIYIPTLGDFISGWIHKELMATTLLSPGDAARFWIGLYCSGIDFLLRESQYIIEGDMIPGNHGRMTDQVYFGDPTGTSLETFAYHAVVARYTSQPRVRLKVSDHAMVYRTFFESFVVRNIHGYEVKYGGGVGGLTIPLNKAISAWDKAVRASCTFLGHFHQRFDGGRFIANGSLIGYNNFAQAIKADFEKATQAFLLIHARHGGEKSLVAPIWLDNDSDHDVAPDLRPVSEPL